MTYYYYFGDLKNISVRIEAICLTSAKIKLYRTVKNYNKYKFLYHEQKN